MKNYFKILEELILKFEVNDLLGKWVYLYFVDCYVNRQQFLGYNLVLRVMKLCRIFDFLILVLEIYFKLIILKMIYMG